jgi:HEAT repeat protein
MAGLDSLLRCSEPLQVLTVAVLVMAFLVLALIVVTISHRALLDRRSKRMDRLRVRYHARMKEALRDPSAMIDTPRTSVEADALCDVIIEMLDEASADEADRLRKRARELGLDTRYKRLACSRSYVKRFRAIERLGFLKLPDTKYFLLSLLGRERAREVVARIVLALTFIVDEEEDLAIINQVLKSPFFKSSKFNEYVYCNIIRSLREAGKEQVFVEFLESLLTDAALPVALKKDIIEACGAAQCYAARDVTLQFFERYHAVPQMRIVCIRALARIGSTVLSEIVRSCLSDPDWRVRAVAARNGWLCSFDVVDHLAECVTDVNYHVRVNAAVSLSQMGLRGHAALSALHHSNDRFARDVARYIMQEAEVRG